MTVATSHALDHSRESGFNGNRGYRNKVTEIAKNVMRKRQIKKDICSVRLVAAIFVVGIENDR